MFSNYQEIIKNWGLAVNSMGFTDNQVKNQMDSLSRRINKLKADLTGLVAQGGNSGLTEWLKECVTELDNLAHFLSTVSASTYSTIGSMAKLAATMYAVNRAMRMIRTSLVATRAGLTTMGVEGAASMSTLRVAVEGVGMAFKRILPVLIATTVVEGISYLVDSLNGETDAVQKQSEALEDNLAVKRQEIEMYTQQEDFLDALFTAHKKLTDEIESSTVSDEKKKKLLEDRIETENQMANIVGWSAVQQMQADNFTDASTKKVRDNYINATEAKKKSLAQFLSARQEEAVENYQAAVQNMQNWKEETDQFCRATGDKISALRDYASALEVVYTLEENFHQWQKSNAEDGLADMKQRQFELSQLQSDPDHEWTSRDQEMLDTVNSQIAQANSDIDRLNDKIYGDRYNIKWEESGQKLAQKEEEARKAFQDLGGANLVNPGQAASPEDFLQKWGSNEGAGGDEYNHTPSGKSKHNKGRTKKDPNYVKEDWQYGDTTSQMFAELSKKFESKFDTRNGLDVATLSAIVTKLTGINTLEFDGVSDPFGTGGRNTWESGRLFYEKMAPYLADGLSVAQALGHLTPGITEQEWKPYLNNESPYLRNKYDYSKNDQKFNDPNEQPGGLYDLGGYSGGATPTGGESYTGSDTDEAHLWDVAVMTASKAKVVKDPRWYWLIMMHESGRGKDPTAIANHNYAGIGGGAGVDMMSDDLFAGQFAATIDGDFRSAPNSIEELVYGMYSNGYFTGDAEAYQSDLNRINNEGLIGGSGGNNQTSGDVNGIQSGGYDVEDKSMYGLDSRYITMSGSWDNIENLQPYVRRLINIIANRYFSATGGQKLDITSLTGGHGASASGYGHLEGYKMDISHDTNEDVIKSILSDYGVSAAFENDHYDVSFGKGGDGRYVEGNTYGIVGNGHGDEAWERYHNGPMQGGANGSIRKPSFWNGRKSTLADFTRDQIAETIYDQERQEKLYEANKKNIEYQMKIHGSTYELLRANDDNEKAYYEAMEKNRKGWIDTYDDLTDSIEDYVNKHAEIKNKLDGKDIFDMPQDELRKLADLSKDDEFKKFVDNLFKVREQLSKADSKLIELRVDKKIRDGYMKPEEDEEYRLKRLEEWYNRTTSNKTDEEKYLDNHELYQSQIDIYKERLKRQKESLKGARRRDQEQLEEYYESLDDFQNGKYNDKGELVEKGLAQYKGDNTDEAKDKIAELKAKVKDIQEDIDQLSKHGSQDFQKLQKDVEDTEAKIREITEKDEEVTKNLWSTIESDIDDMFFDIIKKGSSFKESWRKLWDDVAKIALQQIMRTTVNRWLFNARTTIDDAISNRNVGRNAAINAGFGLASQFTTTPKRWNQVATGNRYLDMANGVTNGNFFPMKSGGTQLTTSVNKAVQETSKLSSVTQKAATLTNVSNTLTQAATAKDALNTTATTTNTAVTQAQIAATQANTEALIMSGASPASIIGGHAMGGLLTTAYANGGMIHGAGTGKSDSILAYLADKDRFVFLSNGEYVMTAEATQRIGKDNLDAMNYGGFADGGALNPTPYVPQISPRVAKRAESVRVSNPNARMEQLMQEQTDTIRNMGNSDASGNVVVLNTHASSDDVMNAIQRNPRAFQSILHNQKRHGFR